MNVEVHWQNENNATVIVLEDGHPIASTYVQRDRELDGIKSFIVQTDAHTALEGPFRMMRHRATYDSRKKNDGTVRV